MNALMKSESSYIISPHEPDISALSAKAEI